MSLSYSLDVAPLQNLDKLSKALIFLGTTSAFTDIFTTGGEARFRNASGAAQDIFPTGEYIIRDGKYINGMFVYVGSYKAYCRDLFGSGSHGYAWDGFIMVMRGYTINGVASILEYSPSLDTYIPSVGFGFLPMRMPFEVNCGASGSASAIAADSSVGLHSLDIYKNINDISVTGDDQDARIMTCGFQRVNPSVESVPTGMDYVANLYFGTLLSYQTNTATLSTGERIVTYQYDPANIMQITWKPLKQAMPTKHLL